MRRRLRVRGERREMARVVRRHRRLLRTWWRGLGFFGEPMERHGPAPSLSLVLRLVYGDLRSGTQFANFTDAIPAAR
jgi:hypothetical protein